MDAQQIPNAPEIIYMEDDLSEDELASLYRACTCTLLPYRGEGFALPPLEGMACGLPAIVTAGGSTDDYLDDSMALRVPFRRRFEEGMYVGPHSSDPMPWMLEPDLPALIDALRWIHDKPEQVQERGQLAQEHCAAGWNWERSTMCVRERLNALFPQSVAPVNATHWTTKPVKMTKRGTTTAAGKKTVKAPSKLNLSLCMIVRNEEARIRECLQSIAPYVDEMIVVDTGSTDQTREIASACGAMVYEFPWCDDFSAARNQSLALAKGKYIFWMDADDVIPEECGVKLRSLVEQNLSLDMAFEVSVRIPPGAGETGETIVDHVKIFPNRPDVRFEFRMHEQVIPSLRRANIEVLPSEIFVVHTNYDRSPEGQSRKRQRDFRQLELDLKDRPNHPFILFNLGMTHLYATKEFVVAAQYLRRSIDSSHWKDSIVRKAYALLTTALMSDGQIAEAVAVNERGRTFYADDGELLFLTGQLYQQVGRFDEARQCLNKLVESKEDGYFRSVDTGLRTYRGRLELALLERNIGDYKRCIESLEQIVSEFPDFAAARIELDITRQTMNSR
ncbi:MAG: glycosyltransferase [Chthonomonadales bacterium]